MKPGVFSGQDGLGHELKIMPSLNDDCWALPRSPVDSVALTQSATDVRSNGNVIEKDRLRRRKIKRLRHPTDSVGLLSCIYFFGSCALSVLLSLIVLALAILLIPFCFVLRKSVLFFATYYHNRQGANVIAMSPSDSIWLRDSPNLNAAAVSTLFFVFEGKVTVGEVSDFIKETWLYHCTVKRQDKFPKLKQEGLKVCGGYAWKESATFLLQDCVIETDGSLTLDLAALPDFSMDIGEKVTPSCNTQLWRVIVFPDYNHSPDTGVMLRMHESIAGIIPFTRLALESLQYKKVYLKKDCFLFKRLCLYVCAAFVAPLLILKRLLMKKDSSFLSRSLSTSNECGFASFLWSEPVDLKTVKRIKDITRTKGNFILFYLYLNLINIRHATLFLPCCRPFQKIRELVASAIYFHFLV